MNTKVEPQRLGQKLPNAPSNKNGTVITDRNKGDSEILEVAKDFSSLFFDTVLQNMRKSVAKSEFLGGGHAEDMYQSMLDSEYAKIMAKQDQTGLARMIAAQLSKMSDKARSTVKKVDQNHAITAYQMTNKPIK